MMQYETLVDAIYHYEPGLYEQIRKKKFKPKSKEELKTALFDWMHHNEKALNLYGHVSSWDVSLITDMSYLFFWNVWSLFNDNINDWDVSNVKNMKSMFKGCYRYNQPMDKWNTKNVEDMSYMFRFCRSFKQNINMWDTSKLQQSCDMFKYTSMPPEYKCQTTNN